MGGCIHGWMDGWIDGWVYGWIGTWMDECISLVDTWMGVRLNRDFLYKNGLHSTLYLQTKERSKIGEFNANFD